MEDQNNEISPEELARLENENCRRRILAWITKHSEPKVLVSPKFIRKPTRFQKLGPMSDEDWLRWKKWVRRFGAPKGKYPPLFRRVVTKPKRPNLDNKELKTERLVKKFYNRKRMIFLAGPKPIKIRQKYEPPPKEPNLTFIPEINLPDPKKSKPRKLSGGVNRHNLTYKLTTDYTRKLSMPRERHIGAPLYPIPSKKFSSHQWKQYRRYLKILSFPKIILPRCEPPMGDQLQSKSWHTSCVCKTEREKNELFERLAQPKKCCTEFDPNQCVKEKQTSYLLKGAGPQRAKCLLEKKKQMQQRNLMCQKPNKQECKTICQKKEEAKQRELRNQKRSKPKGCSKEYDKRCCLHSNHTDWLKKGTNIREIPKAETEKEKRERIEREIAEEIYDYDDKTRRQRKIRIPKPIYPEKRIPKTLQREPPIGKGNFKKPKCDLQVIYKNFNLICKTSKDKLKKDKTKSISFKQQYKVADVIKRTKGGIRGGSKNNEKPPKHSNFLRKGQYTKMTSSKLKTAIEEISSLSSEDDTDWRSIMKKSKSKENLRVNKIYISKP